MLHRKVDASIAEADAGETEDLAQVLAELRQRQRGSWVCWPRGGLHENEGRSCRRADHRLKMCAEAAKHSRRLDESIAVRVAQAKSGQRSDGT